jgi:hypothetical protein
MRTAIVKTSDAKVVNIVIADAGWSPPAGHFTQPDDGTAMIGGTYTEDDGFVDPPAPAAAPAVVTVADVLALLAETRGETEAETAAAAQAKADEREAP